MKTPTRMMQSKPNLQTVRHNSPEAKIVIEAFKLGIIMNTIGATGHFYTSNKDAAATARRMFFDYLNDPHFDVDHYFTKDCGIHGSSWTEYEIAFTNAPIHIYDALTAVYTGGDAIYPYTVGVCATVYRK